MGGSIRAVINKRQSIQHPFSSVANNQEIDDGVKVLRQKDKTKNE